MSQPHFVSPLYAAGLAELTGDPAINVLEEYLTFSATTGNIGPSTAGTGYWVDASVTEATASNESIHVSLSLTATGLVSGESLDLTDLSLDYTWIHLIENFRLNGHLRLGV